MVAGRGPHARRGCVARLGGGRRTRDDRFRNRQHHDDGARHEDDRCGGRGFGSVDIGLRPCTGGTSSPFVVAALFVLVGAGSPVERARADGHADNPTRGRGVQSR
jgi:hypothetical protein